MKENIVKICKKHGELTLSQVKEEINPQGYFFYRCHLCKIEKDRRWKDRNRDQHISCSIRWKKNNREKVNIWSKEDRIKNPEKYKTWAKIGRDRAGILRSIKEVTRIRGLTLDEYYSMVGEQDNKCGICKKHETRMSRTKGQLCRLSIDHNHTTNKARELLCHNCNQVIGHCKESIEILKQAILYLEKHQH